MEDQDLLSIKKDVAVVEARLFELLENLELGIASDWIRKLSRAKNDARAAQRKGDGESLATAVELMMRLIEKGSKDFENWGDINNAIDMHARLSRMESDRILASETSMSSEEVMDLIFRISDVARQCITNPADLVAFVAGIERIRLGGADVEAETIDVEGSERRPSAVAEEILSPILPSSTIGNAPMDGPPT